MENKVMNKDLSSLNNELSFQYSLMKKIRIMDALQAKEQAELIKQAQTSDPHPHQSVVPIHPHPISPIFLHPKQRMKTTKKKGQIKILSPN